MLGFGALLAEVQDAMMQRGRNNRIRSSKITGMIDFLREKECPQDVRNRQALPHVPKSFFQSRVLLRASRDWCLVNQLQITLCLKSEWVTMYYALFYFRCLCFTTF
jgi:hypothetical protein